MLCRASLIGITKASAAPASMTLNDQKRRTQELPDAVAVHSQMPRRSSAGALRGLRGRPSVAWHRSCRSDDVALSDGVLGASRT